MVDALDGPASVVALSDRMWAAHVLGLRAALPGAEQRLAGEILDELRMRKSPAEVDALRAAGAAIDAVHARMAEWLLPGRTERQVGADIAEAIIESGHATVDFVIVASGPNGASPHHATSDRVIRAGEPVVVDIGGTMPSGYCSDSTRTYVVGAPPAEAAAYYAVLHRAQRAAVDAVRPGVTCAQVDAAARDVIADAGYGAAFLHRTGHGIGLRGPRGAVHRGRQRPSPRARHGVLDRAGHLPARAGTAPASKTSSSAPTAAQTSSTPHPRSWPNYDHRPHPAHRGSR